MVQCDAIENGYSTRAEGGGLSTCRAAGPNGISAIHLSSWYGRPDRAVEPPTAMLRCERPGSAAASASCRPCFPPGRRPPLRLLDADRLRLRLRLLLRFRSRDLLRVRSRLRLGGDRERWRFSFFLPFLPFFLPFFSRLREPIAGPPPTTPASAPANTNSRSAAPFHSARACRSERQFE